MVGYMKRKQKYMEEVEVTKKGKQEYVDGLERLIAKRAKMSERIRQSYIKDIFTEPEKYRRDLAEILGWPLTEKREQLCPQVCTEKIVSENDHTIYRMEFEILDGLKMRGLFFRAENKQSAPLVIVQHGGYGTPEMIAGMYGGTGIYNDMLQRVLQQGVHVFAPQLLLWKVQDYEVEYDLQIIDARLKRVGSSITAVEIFGIQRILDFFEMQDYVTTFGMVGFSYGGFFTLFTSALDTRIQSAISCSYFGKKDELRTVDWSWFSVANKFDDAEIACLVYPRRLCIQMGMNDEFFNSKLSRESFEKMKAYCQDVGADWLEFIMFDGVHEFYQRDIPIERLIKDINTP